MKTEAKTSFERILRKKLNSFEIHYHSEKSQIKNWTLSSNSDFLGRFSLLLSKKNYYTSQSQFDVYKKSFSFIGKSQKKNNATLGQNLEDKDQNLEEVRLREPHLPLKLDKMGENALKLFHFFGEELQRDAKKSQINKAYRRIAFKLHPDRNPMKNPSYKTKFQDLVDARDSLLRILVQPIND